jgi:hypothetical protein
MPVGGAVCLFVCGRRRPSSRVPAVVEAFVQYLRMVPLAEAQILRVLEDLVALGTTREATREQAQ